jgi:rubredoxin
MMALLPDDPDVALGRRCPGCGALFDRQLFNMASGFFGRGPTFPKGPFLRQRRCPDCGEWSDADDFEWIEMKDKRS